jgi:hypothetical protein
MEEMAGELVPSAIEGISGNGVAEMLKVNTYLVCSPGARHAGNDTESVFA